MTKSKCVSTLSSLSAPATFRRYKLTKNGIPLPLSSVPPLPLSQRSYTSCPNSGTSFIALEPIQEPKHTSIFVRRKPRREQYNEIYRWAHITEVGWEWRIALFHPLSGSLDTNFCLIVCVLCKPCFIVCVRSASIFSGSCMAQCLQCPGGRSSVCVRWASRSFAIWGFFSDSMRADRLCLEGRRRRRIHRKVQEGL